MKPKTLYHITAADAWQAAVKAGSYTGTEMDARDGFIHLSTAEQAERSAELHFKGRSGLILLVVDSERLEGTLKWEAVAERDGQEFPHLFGSIPLEAVHSVEPLPLDADGTVQFPFLKDPG